MSGRPARPAVISMRTIMVLERGARRLVDGSSFGNRPVPVRVRAAMQVSAKDVRRIARRMREQLTD